MTYEASYFSSSKIYWGAFSAKEETVHFQLRKDSFSSCNSPRLARLFDWVVGLDNPIPL